jgi:hypothetical protein
MEEEEEKKKILRSYSYTSMYGRACAAAAGA